jgi:hypothetical protein
LHQDDQAAFATLVKRHGPLVRPAVGSRRYRCGPARSRIWARSSSNKATSDAENQIFLTKPCAPPCEQGLSK